MNIEELKKLSLLLKEDAAKPDGVKFDLSVWSRPGDERYNPLAAGSRDNWYWRPEEAPDWSCGTAACALGLAAISGWFPGLKMAMLGDAWVPTYYGETGMTAARFFFGLTAAETYFLFSADRYPSHLYKGAEAELEVARRIDYLVEHGREEFLTFMENNR